MCFNAFRIAEHCNKCAQLVKSAVCFKTYIILIDTCATY